MEVITRPPTTKGPAQTFTGDVWVDGIYAGPTQEQARLAVVRFAPCARSQRTEITRGVAGPLGLSKPRSRLRSRRQP